MRTLIVGAGISGLTLACFLKRHEGFEVDIIDKCSDWAHLGFTLGIWDVGRRVLSKLDLDKNFDRLGRRIHTMRITDRDNKHVINMNHFEDFYKQYESAYTHISRKDLHDLLVAESGMNINMCSSPKTISQTKDIVTVEFNDGMVKEYDLVVGADGLHSKVRELIFPRSKIQYTGNRVWFAWVNSKFVQRNTVTEMIYEKTFFNLFDDPTSGCAVLMAKEKPLKFDEVETRIKRLRKHFKGFASPVPEIISTTPPENFTPTDIAYVDSDDWVRNRVVLIGDAAHAMEQYGGIGASMGMEDAYVLSDELIQVGKNSVAKALRRYTNRRLPRIEIARRQTRNNYWWMTFKFPGVMFIRKHLARLIPIKHFTKGYATLLETEP